MPKCQGPTQLQTVHAILGTSGAHEPAWPLCMRLTTCPAQSPNPASICPQPSKHLPYNNLINACAYIIHTRTPRIPCHNSSSWSCCSLTGTVRPRADQHHFCLVWAGGPNRQGRHWMHANGRANHARQHACAAIRVVHVVLTAAPASLESFKDVMQQVCKCHVGA